MNSCSRFDLAQKFSHRPDVHQHLFKLWEDFKINQTYQNMFLSYLDQLSFKEAQQIISKEVKLLYQKKSLYFILQENLDLRNQILEQLMAFIDQTQNQNLQQQRLPDICDKINNLRKINLLTSETLLKILSEFGLQPESSSILVAKQYIQIFNKINQENIGLKESFLNEYILFQNGFDPFFITHYQLLMRSNKPEYRKSKAVQKLFTLNISYAYRLLRAQKKIITYLSKTNADIEVPNPQLTPHLNKKKVKINKQPHSFQRETKYQYNESFQQNHMKRSHTQKMVDKNIGQTLKANNILKFPKINQRNNLDQSAQTSKIYGTKKPSKYSNSYPIILEESQKNNNKFAGGHLKRKKSIQKYSLKSQQSDDEAYDIEKNLVQKVQKKKPKQRYSLDNKQTDRRKNVYKSSFFGSKFQTQIQSIESENYIFRNKSSQRVHDSPNSIKQKKTQYLKKQPIFNQNKIIKQRLNSQLQNDSSMSLKQKIWNKKDYLKKLNPTLNSNKISPINRNKKQPQPQIEQQNSFKNKSKVKLNLQPAFNYNFSFHPETKNTNNSVNNSPGKKYHKSHQQFQQQKGEKSQRLKTDRYETIEREDDDKEHLKSRNKTLDNDFLDNDSPNNRKKQKYQKYSEDKNKQDEQNQTPFTKQYSNSDKKYNQGNIPNNNIKTTNKQNNSNNFQNKFPTPSQNSRESRQIEQQQQQFNSQEEDESNNVNEPQKKNDNSSNKSKTNQLKNNFSNNSKREQPVVPQNKNQLVKNQLSKSQLPIKNKSQNLLKGSSLKLIQNQKQIQPKQLKLIHNQNNEKLNNNSPNQKNNNKQNPKLSQKQQQIKKPEIQKMQSNSPPKNSGNFKSLSLKNKIQPNEVDNKNELKNGQQASSKVKQIKMKPDKLQFSQLNDYLAKKTFLKGYQQIIKQSISSIKKIAQNTQTYLMQFFINDEVVLVSLCSPTTIGDIIIYLWGPIAQKCTDKSSIFFFNKYIQYLQKNTTSKSIFYKGSQISQVKSNNFQKVKEKLYSRKRVAPITRQSFQFQPFLSFQISNVYFQLANSEPILYSEQIQPFSDSNSFINQILVQKPQKLPNSIKSQIILNQNIKSLQQINSILEKDSYDTYEIGPEINAQAVNMSRMMLHAGPKSGFICHEGYIVAIGNYFVNQKEKKQIFRVQLTKNINMYFSKAFKKVQEMYNSIYQQKQKKYSQQIQFAFKMFSKQLYGQLKFRNNKQTHFYGNWDTTFAWRDQILGKLGRVIPKDFRFGPQSFFLIIQLNGVLLFGFQVIQSDFLS